jgi:hypothetical protein
MLLLSRTSSCDMPWVDELAPLSECGFICRLNTTHFSQRPPILLHTAYVAAVKATTAINTTQHNTTQHNTAQHIPPESRMRGVTSLPSPKRLIALHPAVAHTYIHVGRRAGEISPCPMPLLPHHHLSILHVSNPPPQRGGTSKPNFALQLPACWW